MTEIQSETDVSSPKKRINADQDEQTTPADITTDPNDTEQKSENPFTSSDKRPKKKFKKSITNAAENAVDEAANETNGLMPKPAQSKRQKKKLKQIQNVSQNKDKEIEKTIAYLTKWNESRDEWKFEKLRQIFIQNNIFNDNVISEEHSAMAINYLVSAKGAARANLTSKAEETIKDIENKINDENSDELTSSAPYKRAREILQSFQD